MEPILAAEQRLRAKASRSVAYFSMEYGLSTNSYNPLSSCLPETDANRAPDLHIFSNMRAIDYYLSVRTGHRLDLPIYSGGLGVLAGDTLKSSADLNVPLVAVGILWKKGYFKQNFWFKDGQIPEETKWDPSSYPGLVPLSSCVEIPLKKESIRLRLWKYFVYSFDKKNVVPLVLLDSDVSENSDLNRRLTGQLYKSDNNEWKILQRIILGIGGMKAVEALGYRISRYHLNEGHAALAFVEKAKHLSGSQIGKLKNHFAYTCHTPVAAGHDRFQKKTVSEYLSDEQSALLKKHGQDPHYPDQINLTLQAMHTSRFVNAVAKKHGEISRLQFPDNKDRIESITNGVHTHTWISEPITRVLDRHDGTFGDWRQDPTRLARALELKDDAGFRRELWEAHQTNKKKLCSLLKSWRVNPDLFTICWARRIASYKRPSLILQDVGKIVDLARTVGPIQILFAGKAHPKDDLGFTFVNEMLSTIDSLEKERGLVRVLMLENYDTYLGKLLTSGVDVWLNNPLPPFEASGTSGMKAILNGVLQLSTLDGWVVEAADRNLGWIFGWQHNSNEVGDERNLRLKEDAGELYGMLKKVVELYYRTESRGELDITSDWLTKMVHAIAAAGYFNTHRMVREYQDKIWLRP